MKTLILTGAMLAISGSALAHQCELDFDGKMKLENKTLTITTEDADKIKINQRHQVFVNNQQITLNSEQQRWATEYYQGITAAAPKVADIAMEGISIATTAVNQVFGELLGQDHKVLSELNEKLEKISHDVEYSFYAEDGNIRIDADSEEEGNVFGPEWGQEFEQSIEELVVSSMGSIMVAVGTEMLFNGGDMSQFEQKMENFADNIEQNVELRGEALEQKADELCIELAAVAYAENKLQETIPALNKLDVLNVYNDNQAM